MKERNIYISIFTTLLVFIIYVFRVYSMYETGQFDGADGLKLAGKSILMLIGIMAAANIVFQILGTIFMSVTGKDCKVDVIEDERDKLIELKGMQLSYAVFGAGMVLTFVAVTTGWSGAVEALYFIVGSVVLAEIVGNIKKLFHYRRGF
jgi:hypothetical protein